MIKKKIEKESGDTMYTLEELLQKYDELEMVRRQGYSNLDPEKNHYFTELEDRLSANLRAYGKALAEQNPNDRRIISTVYAAMPLWAPRIYEGLSEDLQNDKFVTMMALKKFDESSYGRVGASLRGDKETMFLLATQTAGELSVTQFAPSLLADQNFWSELLGDSDVFHLLTESEYSSFLYRVNRLNEKYKLGINMGTLISATQIAKTKEQFYHSPLKVMGNYDFWINNPYIVKDIAEGKEDTIQKNVRGMLKQELLEQARQMATQKLVEEAIHEIPVPSQQNPYYH